MEYILQINLDSGIGKESAHLIVEPGEETSLKDILDEYIRDGDFAAFAEEGITMEEEIPLLQFIKSKLYNPNGERRPRLSKEVGFKKGSKRIEPLEVIATDTLFEMHKKGEEESYDYMLLDISLSKKEARISQDDFYCTITLGSLALPLKPDDKREEEAIEYKVKNETAEEYIKRTFEHSRFYIDEGRIYLFRGEIGLQFRIDAEEELDHHKKYTLVIDILGRLFYRDPDEIYRGLEREGLFPSSVHLFTMGPFYTAHTDNTVEMKKMFEKNPEAFAMFSRMLWTKSQEEEENSSKEEAAGLFARIGGSKRVSPPCIANQRQYKIICSTSIKEGMEKHLKDHDDFKLYTV